MRLPVEPGCRCTRGPFFTLLLAVLIAGTLQVRLLTGASAQGPQVWLDCVVPPSAALGIEGLSTHGVLLNGG
jgi:hypothetical protein